uniref:FAR1 domain-containing protein n=1 Tax=Triticum urartu TaxID=4572 RepID=A0A8R7UB52_TRIUA
MGSIGNRIPKVGMRFRNSDEAWEFWVQYGGHIGFDLRKRNTIRSRIDGTITSCRFVCSNEGIRRKNQIDHEPKRIRAETRTNCKVRMIVSFDRVANFFEVTEVDLEHNHLLQLPQTCHLLASQRKISDVQALEIETADDSGIMPKASHEFACRRAGGKFNVGYTLTDQKNHLRTKRQREMAYGQAGSMLKFFRD